MLQEFTVTLQKVKIIAFHYPIEIFQNQQIKNSRTSQASHVCQEKVMNKYVVMVCKLEKLRAKLVTRPFNHLMALFRGLPGQPVSER